MQTPEAVKALRLAAGLTQRELSLATGIFKITDAELGDVELNKNEWWMIQIVCNDRIKMFKEDA